MGISQSNPSLPTQTIERKYEVFLNFRGIDTRSDFTFNLYEALRAKTIETFMDDDGIPIGDEIGPKLLKTIRESKISVVIFSKEYTSSKWCLRELVEIMECKEKNGQTVIPVFYQVSATDVGDLHGSFMKGFDKLKRRFDEKLAKEQVDSADVEKRKKKFDQQMQKGRRALEDASHLKGLFYENGRESEVIDKIVEHISEKLQRACKPSPYDFEGLFGLGERVRQVMSLLSLDNTDIRIIGIWGMGGIGKTAIAEVIYRQISYDEYGTCFIGNFRQRLEECGGLVGPLQQEVISVVLNDPDIQLDDVFLPQCIKERLRKKKVFIVLDDVDEFFKLTKLAGGIDQLGAGSRIVITTRNRDVLRCCRVHDDYIYEVKGLSNQTFEVLQISYNGLKELEKQAFLDIACFFVGEHIDYVAKILDDYCSLWILLDRSLITISNNNTIQMPDLLQKMGREIVRNEDHNNPGHCSRLWTQEVVLDALKNGDGTNAIRGIFLNMSKMNEKHLSSQAFENMKNLRFLKFYDSTFYEDGNDIFYLSKLYSSYVHFPNGLSYLSDMLRSLNWVGYPLKALPLNFIPKYLVELNLRYSNIEKIWEDNMRAPRLKWIVLKHCPYLIKVSDLLDAPLVEKIDIQSCESLLGFPSPVHHFNNLRELNLRDCEDLQSFPNNIPFPSLVSLDLSGCINLARISDVLDAPFLEKINLRNCKSLLDFPPPAQHFNKLCGINLEDCSKLLYFPAPFQHFHNLCNMNLWDCENLRRFLSDNIHLPSLICLDFRGCIELTEFPHISGNITRLYLRKTKIDKVPSSIENLPELVELDLAECTRLKHISTSIHKLKALGKINLRNCSALESFPEISDTMGSLKILDLSRTAIKGLHHSIENLIGLEEMYLRECNDLDEVPSSIENLTKLVKLDLAECKRLKHFAISICKLEALRLLNLRNCSALECFPEILDRMGSLEFLDLSGTAIKGLDHSIESLSGLEKLCLRECKNLEMLPISIYNLTSLNILDLSGCSKLENLPGNLVTDISNCGESATTKPPICRLSECKLYFTNCLNLNKIAVINIMELQINQHRDMTAKGCGTQAVNLNFFYPGSEVPSWFKCQTDGSSINIQMSGHDGVNGHLIGLAACAVIEFCEEGYDFEGLAIDISYWHRCHCKDHIRKVDKIKVSYEDETLANHVALWYSNASILELCESECPNYLFEFFLFKSPMCKVKYCGVCPIYER